MEHPVLEQEINFWQYYIQHWLEKRSGPVPERAWEALTDARFRMNGYRAQIAAGAAPFQEPHTLH